MKRKFQQTCGYQGDGSIHFANAYYPEVFSDKVEIWKGDVFAGSVGIDPQSGLLKINQGGDFGPMEWYEERTDSVFNSVSLDNILQSIGRYSLDEGIGIFDLNKDIVYKLTKLDAALQRCNIRISNYVSTTDGKSYQKVVEKIADGLVFGSPIYFGEITGQMRAFLERLSFPWLSYNDYSMTAPKQMPVVLIETMNGAPDRNNSNGFGSMEFCITRALGQPQHLIAYNTYQVKDYDRYELAGFSEEAKHQWRDAHWEEDLQKAFDAGRKMATA